MALRDLRSQADRRSPDQLVQHLKSFDLKLRFSAGIWFFSPPQSRFHDRYKPIIEIEPRLEIAASLKDYGLEGLEAHYPNEINEENLDIWKKFSRDTGIRIVTVIPLLFWDDQFEWGSLSNPIPEIRRVAIDRTIRALQLNKELDTELAVVWPGIDGYENSFGVDLRAARDRFAEGLAEAMDTVPGVRVAEEPKPYEPRGHILYGTTYEGILLGLKVEALLKHAENRRLLGEGHALVALNPEMGHMLMGYEDTAYSYGMAMEYARLAHTHWNSQPLGNYDQDLNVGVISPEALEATLYALKMYGYDGWFGLDINPERMPVATGLKNSMDALRAANDRINQLDHESIIWATEHPDRARGWLEAYLIRARAARPDALPPMPPLK
ncbi:MAG TPA: TIM barrel protein [Chloroflexota bacterium]|nr:TIM barrel protein [Chloroflexota bacterium]